MVATRLMTAEEFAALPDDNGRAELIRGVLYRTAPPGFEHGGITTDLSFALKRFADPRRVGRVVTEAGFLFARHPDIVRAPDVAALRTERLPSRETWRGYSPVLPDLAVEVVSPRTIQGRSPRWSSSIWTTGCHWSGWCFPRRGRSPCIGPVPTLSCWVSATNWMARTCCRGFVWRWPTSSADRGRRSEPMAEAAARAMSRAAKSCAPRGAGSPFPPVNEGE